MYYLFALKKYGISNQTNLFVFDGEFQKYSISKQFFLKKTAGHATLSFLLCIDRCEMKNVQPLLLFLTGGSCLLLLCMLL